MSKCAQSSCSTVFVPVHIIVANRSYICAAQNHSAEIDYASPLVSGTDWRSFNGRVGYPHRFPAGTILLKNS